jgi:hypothetical protein
VEFSIISFKKYFATFFYYLFIYLHEADIMNRVFFGGTRDLFTFDLVRHIMKADPAFNSFTFVPMLTGSDGISGGKTSTGKDLAKARKIGKAGSQNQDLMAQMKRLQEIDSDPEYFQNIREYFSKEHILTHITSEEQFSHKGRTRYFEHMLSHIPQKSLIFLNPDIGLEETKSSEKHILFDEVKRIADGMDNRSALMIYQHLPRTNHDGYIRQRCSRLDQLTGIAPLTIADNEILFFLLVKNEKLKNETEVVLERYANSYPLLSSCTGS